MKTRIGRLIILIAMVAILLLLASCNGKPKEESKKYSEGLEFTLNEEGTGYLLSGKGDCKDYEVVVPDAYNGLPVVGVGEKAFYQTKGTQSIKLPDSVVRIGEWSFAQSTLAEIYIPGSVRVIADHAFANCGYLRVLEIENGLETIEQAAFRACGNLKKVKLPASLKEIGDMAFYRLDELEEFEVDPDNENFSSIDGNLYADNGKKLMYYACAKKDREFEIPYGTEEIGSYAFENAKLNVITIPDTVKIINKRAFAGNYCLESLTLPKSVKKIGEGIMVGCYNFKTLYYNGTHNEWILVSKAGAPDPWNKGMPEYRFDCSDAYYDCVPGESSTVNWK